MNVTYEDYGKLTQEGKGLYDTIANYLLFESEISELDNINFQDKISELKSEEDRSILREFLLSKTANSR